MSKYIMLVIFFIFNVSAYSGCGLSVCKIEDENSGPLKFKSLFQYRYVSIERGDIEGSFHEYSGMIGLYKGRFQGLLKIAAVNLEVDGKESDGFLNPILDFGYVFGSSQKQSLKFGLQYEVPIGDELLASDHHELLCYGGFRKDFSRFSLEGHLGFRFSLGEDDENDATNKKAHTSLNEGFDGSSYVTPHESREFLFRLQGLYHFNSDYFSCGFFVNSENPTSGIKIESSENSVGSMFFYHLKKSDLGLEFSKSVFDNNRFDYCLTINYEYKF